jgi:hypothetical protein
MAESGDRGVVAGRGEHVKVVPKPLDKGLIDLAGVSHPAPWPNQRRQGPWAPLLGMLSLVVIAVAMYQLLGAQRVAPLWQLEVSLVCVLWLAAFLTLASLQVGSPYLLTSAYVLGLALFHLGITVPGAFGVFEGFGWPQTGPEAYWLAQAGWYTALAFGAIGLGFSVGASRMLSQPERADPVGERTLAVLYWDGIGLLIASGIFLGIAVASYGNLLAYSRVEFFHATGDSRGLGVFLMSFPSAVILVVLGARTAPQLLFATLLGVFAFAALAMSGYRSAAFFPLLMGAVLWVKTGRRIPIVIAAGAMAGVIFLIPVIGTLRSHGPYEDIDTRTLTQSVATAELQETFRTLGQTAGILGHVLRLVPDRDPHRWGMTYVQALRNSIPNVMPQIRKSARQQLNERAFGNSNAITEMSASDWATYRISPERFDVGEGVGFSGIAEPYLNFGMPGVVGFFLLLGFLLGRLDSIALLHHPHLLVFAAATLWTLGRTVRNDFTSFVKPAIFMLIILLIWRLANLMVPLPSPYRRTFEMREALR